jgi:membrane protease YdiL (CAAX protease family)
MHLPGTHSLVFLAYLLVLLPWLAFRSAGKLREVREASAGRPVRTLSRERVWIGTIVSLALLLWLAWVVGSSFGYPFFAVPALGIREWLAAAAALAVCFALRTIARATRSENERRKMAVYFIAPRTSREWVLASVTVVLASVSEETAYRGVGLSILWFSLGNAWVAALICAVAFALGHWTQGWKSGVVIFVLALTMHGLVAYTGTLVLAMLVHAVYDFVAGYQIAVEARRFDRESATLA